MVGLNNGLAKVFVISTGQLLAELDCKGAVGCASFVFNVTESWTYSFFGDLNRTPYVTRYCPVHINLRPQCPYFLRIGKVLFM